MADLIPARLTSAERALAHAVGFCAVSRMHDDRLGLVIDALRRLLTRVPAQDATTRLRMAAQGLIDTYPRRHMAAGAADWCLANLNADNAAQDYHWAAFCALGEG
jgi:hypothetical protein